MTTIPLNPVAQEWNYKYARLMENAWLYKKTERSRRLREHNAHIGRYCPEIRKADPGLVVDVGPGPGEFLELCRACGHSILGIDAPNGKGGMGDDYLQASRLMQERQQIPMDFAGFEGWVNGEHPTINHTVALINFRGSIEQALSRHMIGDPHHLHHQCKRLSWSMTAGLKESLQVAFTQMTRLLRSEGALLIVANGSANDADYDTMMIEAGKEAGLILVRHEPHLVHKWRKA